MDLWTLLVETIAGGFWLAVILMIVTFFIILALGGVSLYDNMWFNIVFLFSMAMGYGYALFTVAISIFVLGWFLFELVNWLERAGQG